jgi:hypothetical protein
MNERRGLKINLNDDFELREEANTRFRNKQDDLAMKLAQLETIGSPS